MRLGSAPSRGIGTLLVISSLSIGCEVNTGWILSPEGCSNKTAVDAELHVDTSDDR
jgi:hypothetical protein